MRRLNAGKKNETWTWASGGWSGFCMSAGQCCSEIRSAYPFTFEPAGFHTTPSRYGNVQLGSNGHGLMGNPATVTAFAARDASPDGSAAATRASTEQTGCDPRCTCCE